MFKNISKVVLASFLFTGVAKAALIYNDDSNRFTLDVKAEMYATHDRYGFDKKGDGRTTGPVELVGTITVENFYTRMFSEDFSAITNLKLKVPVFGYSSGAFGFFNAERMNQSLETFRFVDRANLNIVHSYVGTITAGRYKSFYSDLVDYSDVDIFIGTPATATKSDLIFGGCTETGIAYSKSFINNALVLGISVDASKDAMPYVKTFFSGKVDKGDVKLDYILKKDYKVGSKVQYNITDDIKVGAAYNIAGFRVSKSSTIINNNNIINEITELGRNVGQNIITGISYNKRGTVMGITGNFQDCRFKIAEDIKNYEQVFGVEAGVSYDISGVGTGFRPSIQYDFKKGYYKNKNKVNNEKIKEHTLNVNSVELGLSYYVNPRFHYVAAAVVDLRTDKQVAKVDNVDCDLVKKRHYLGVGVVYKF